MITYVSLTFTQRDDGMEVKVSDPTGGSQRDPGHELGTFIVEGTDDFAWERLFGKAVVCMSPFVKERATK